jgi:predicted Zn-dependent protease
MSRLLALGLVIAAVLGGCAQGSNVRLGGLDSLMNVTSTARGAFSDVEEPEEIELGRAVTAAIGGRYPLLRDPVLTRYVALVGNIVAAQSERPDVRYYFGVLDSPEVNAFAAPGGYIFVTKGALALMRDEATLAGVLGHEIAHVAARHHLETIKASKRKDLTVMGLRTGLAFAPGPAGSFAGVISLAADAMVEQVVLKGFSRAEEGQADGLGVGYASRAGYDRAGLQDFLLAVSARSDRDPSAGRFFSTHPGTAERLKDLEKLPPSQAGGQRNRERFAAEMPKS